MPSLLSGSVLRRGGSNEFLDLEGAQPQLPATDTTETGFTLITDSLLRTRYDSSLGHIQIMTATMKSLLPSRNIRITSTGTSRILSTTTNTGLLLVDGGIGVWGNMYIDEDIRINDILVGTGYEGQNNIVIRGTAIPPDNDENNGQESIAIGYDTLNGLITANKSLGIGRFALSSGTNLRRTIAIGDSALMNIGIIHSSLAGYISTLTLTNPILITVPNHNLKDGDFVEITGISSGTVEIDGLNLFVQRVNSSTFELFYDDILSIGVDATTYTPWNSASTATAKVSKVYKREGNIAYGVEAGLNLVDGAENIFIGHQAGLNITTGTYNIIVGQNLFSELVNVNNCISIGGDQIVDGTDNQVNIGSVFYYNGKGKLDFNANTEFGIGTQASVITPGPYKSTSTITGALMVNGGGILRGNLIIAKNFEQLGTETNYISSSLIPSTGTLVTLGSLTNPFQDLYLSGSSLYIGGQQIISVKSTGTLSFGTTQTNFVIESASSATTTTGALRVIGGVSVGGDLIVTGQIIAQGISGGSSASSLESITTVGNSSTNQIIITNSTESTSTTTGAMIITGGLGVGKRVTAESLRIDDTLFDSTSISVITTSKTIISSFDLNEYRSAKFLIQVDEGIGVGSDFDLTEILVVFDNSGVAYPLTYGVKTPGPAMGSYSFTVAGNIANLNYTASSATNKTIKILRTGMIR